jgi:hypothetical protein
LTLNVCITNPTKNGGELLSRIWASFTK